MAAQLVGIAATVFSILSFQCSTRKKILIMQLITTILFCVHYLMLGAFTGATLNAVSIVRNIIFYNNDKKFFSGKKWIVIFVLINIGAGALTWQSWSSLLFIIGMVLNTISLSLTASQQVRWVMLMSSPFVLVYSFLTGSIGGVVNELCSEVSMITALVRYRKEN